MRTTTWILSAPQPTKTFPRPRRFKLLSTSSRLTAVPFSSTSCVVLPEPTTLSRLYHHTPLGICFLNGQCSTLANTSPPCSHQITPRLCSYLRPVHSALSILFPSRSSSFSACFFLPRLLSLPLLVEFLSLSLAIKYCILGYGRGHHDCSMYHPLCIWKGSPWPFNSMYIVASRSDLPFPAATHQA